MDMAIPVPASWLRASIPDTIWYQRRTEEKRQEKAEQTNNQRLFPLFSENARVELRSGKKSQQYCAGAG
ncbi:hypothetical protein QYS46_03400 [Klebsiella michiganensis]|nr:hypothetical protein [Klebsiella michiganensis]